MTLNDCVFLVHAPNGNMPTSNNPHRAD